MDVLRSSDIGFHFHTGFLELFSGSLGQCLAVGEENKTVVAVEKEEEGDENGIIRNVASSQVQQPGDVGEVVDEIVFLRAHFLSQQSRRLCQLVLHGNTCPLQELNVNRFSGQSRAVFPNGVKRIGERQAEFQTALAKFLRIGLGEHVGRSRHTVRTLGDLLAQPFDGRGYAGIAIAHQSEGSVAQFFFRLQPIARVGPKRGFGQRHHRKSGTAGETGQPFATLPMGSNVLTAVSIGSRNDIGINLGRLPTHPFAQTVHASTYSF